MKMLFTIVLLRIEDYMLPCFTKSIFGFDCPGCGLQRSIAFLIKGDIAAAWDMYPAIFTIIPLFIFLGLDFFFSFKHANKIVIPLMVASFVLILTNFTLKFI